MASDERRPFLVSDEESVALRRVAANALGRMSDADADEAQRLAEQSRVGRSRRRSMVEYGMWLAGLAGFLTLAREWLPFFLKGD